MTIAYLDTSAAMKLVIGEAETAALVSHLSERDDGTLVASWLLHTELHCAAGRRPDVVAAAQVRDVLDRVALVDLTRGDLISAGVLAPLRSQDALHLAVALRLGVDELITYDGEMARAALAAGVTVLGPGF